MPRLYARHVQEIGGSGVGQIALSIPGPRFTPSGPKWMAKWTGADPESQRLDHEGYDEARHIITQAMGGIRDYVFSRSDFRIPAKEERWSVSTSLISKDDYTSLVAKLGKVKGVGFLNPHPEDFHYSSHLDHLITQLVQLNNIGVPQQSSK